MTKKNRKLIKYAKKHHRCMSCGNDESLIEKCIQQICPFLGQDISWMARRKNTVDKLPENNIVVEEPIEEGVNYYKEKTGIYGLVDKRSLK